MEPMPLSDARRFLIDISDMSELRAALGSAGTPEQFTRTLHDASYDFTQQELAYAFHGLHARCQSPEQADHLRNIFGWWNYLLMEFNSSGQVLL
jgi:hypothetical protein